MPTDASTISPMLMSQARRCSRRSARPIPHSPRSRSPVAQRSQSSKNRCRSSQASERCSGGLDGWQMAGFGGFMELGANIIETIDGIGLLWYTREQFDNFILRLDWRASFPDDNSGVFIRFPALGNTDPANDWKPPVDQGYEIQIDDTGKNPDVTPNVFNDPLHRTGAVYKLAPANNLSSLPLGQWNTYQIEANGNDIKVTLNGQLVSHLQNGNRSLKGFIGLQNHHFGSKVQFKNIRIRPL